MKKLLLFAVVAASTQFAFAQIPDLEFDYIKSNQGYGKIIEFDMNNSPSDIRAYRFMTEQAGLFGGSVLSLQSKTHNTWSSRLTFSGDRVGIGTNSPGSLLHVNGKAQMKELTVAPTVDGFFTRMGKLLSSGNRLFNYHQAGEYSGYTYYDTAGNLRLNYQSDSDSAYFGLKDENELEIFKAAHDPSIGSFVHLPQAQSRLIIGDFGSYQLSEGYKLVVKEGSANVEGDFIARHVGIGTSNPLNRLQITESISFHDGGHDVIGFGYAPGPNTDFDTAGYASNIRLDPVNGRFTLGIATSTSGLPAGNMLVLNKNGNVGIGSTEPDSKLTVNGKIHAKEVKVDLAIPADYVFEKYYNGSSELKEDYIMPTLEEVAAFTKENKHLPALPSAKEIQENGLELGDMTNLLLQKIEELTLYTIEQEKRIQDLEKRLYGQE